MHNRDVGCSHCGKKTYRWGVWYSSVPVRLRNCRAGLLILFVRDVLSILACGFLVVAYVWL